MGKVEFISHGRDGVCSWSPTEGMSMLQIVAFMKDNGIPLRNATVWRPGCCDPLLIEWHHRDEIPKPTVKKGKKK